MKGIESFLEKFKKLLKYDREIKKIIIEVVKNIIGVEVKEEDIKIQNKILYIKANPYIKNEIFIKKDLILERLKKSLKNKIIKDIR